MGFIGIIVGLIGAAVGIVAGLLGGLIGIAAGLLGGLIGLMPFLFPLALITIGIIWLVKKPNSENEAGVRARGITPAPPQTPYSRQ